MKLSFPDSIDLQTPIEYYNMGQHSDFPGEKWHPIAGFEDLYQVSNFGRIKALPVIKKHGRYSHLHPERILKPSINKRGYHRYSISNDGETKYPSGYNLVGKYFLQNTDSKPTVNHRYGNKDDNRYFMLEWSTHKEQINHADDTGLRNVRGESCHLSKLTKEQVIEIRETYNGDRKWFAQKYNVYRSVINKIIKRQIWRHI